MIRHLCDSCGKEYTPDTNTSMFRFIELSLLNPNNVQMQPKMKEQEFCSTCTERIKKAIKVAT